MFKCLIVLIILCQTVFLKAQSYEVQAFQNEYTEINDYNSLILDIGGPRPNWRFRFDLDFEFPFFDSVYSSIYGRFNGFFGFETDWYPIILFNIPTMFDEDIDIFNIQSDIRYKLTVENDLKCLVLQYTKVRFFDDPSVEEHDSYLNYQVWFFEDGAIEMRFGSMNLEHSPGYSPGEGFFLIFTNQDLLIPINVDMGIASPDFQLSYFVSGNHNDFDVMNYDDVSKRGIRDLPPEGWVFRFSPKASSIGADYSRGFNIYPNPVKGDLFIEDFEESPQSVEIIDAMGRTVAFYQNFDKRIDVSDLARGIYIVRVKFYDRIVSKKIIKK